MKLIIDIDDELVETARFAVRVDMGDDYVKSIANGIPLDNLIDEIEQIEINGHIRDVECFTSGINTALNVINKYKAESEK